MKGNLNWKLYGILGFSLLLTAILVFFVDTSITSIMTEDYLTIWNLIGMILLAIILLGGIITILIFVILKGYRKRISTRLAIIFIIVGISIPLWLLVSEPIYKPGRNTIEIWARSLDGNHTIDVEYMLDFDKKYQDVGNITNNLEQNFLDIRFKIRGNVSLIFKGIDLEQLYWSGIDEWTNVQFHNISNEYSFKFNQSTVLKSDIFWLHIDGALTRPNVRLYALSVIMMVENNPRDNKILNFSQSVEIENLYNKKISLESTNLALTHIRDDYYISKPIEQRYSSENNEIIFYNIDVEFSTRWTRFSDELTLIFLAIFIEPLLEIRSIIIELTERLEKRGEKQLLVSQESTQENSETSNANENNVAIDNNIITNEEDEIGE